MQPCPPRLLAITLLVGGLAVVASCGGETPASPTPAPPPVIIVPPPAEEPVPPVHQPPAVPPPIAGAAWVNVFGDTGWCGSPVMPQIARLLESLGGDVLLAGDLAYDNGTLDEFRRCFDPHFGRFRSRTWAVPGNHEYGTPGANGFFAYFGDRAGDDRSGFFALQLSGWQVLMLNSNLAMNRGSRQFEFVRHQMETAPRCTLAVWHHPFDSSGPNGPNPTQRELWELLHARHADVVVSAHDHLYERHAPMNAGHQADPAHGIRLFISGGGGAPPYQRARAAPRSEVMISTHGVLRLKLEPALYEWEFLAPSGAVLDRGLTVCH